MVNKPGFKLVQSTFQQLTGPGRLEVNTQCAFTFDLVIFPRMKKAKTDFKEYMEAFDDELKSFLVRVKERAEARIERAMKEAEEVRLKNRKTHTKKSRLKNSLIIHEEKKEKKFKMFYECLNV